MRNIHKALKRGGKLILLDSVISLGNEPQFGKLIDLEMMVGPGGKERTEEEFRELFAGSGFRLTRVVHTKSPLAVIEGERA